jgi:hypothetical protein
VLGDEPALEVLVLACDLRMRAQVVSEGERPRFLRVTRANNMDVVSVRPDVRLMEEGQKESSGSGMCS